MSSTIAAICEICLRSTAMEPMGMNRAVGGRKIAVSACVHPGVGKPGFLGLAAFAVPWSGVTHCFANLGVSLGDLIGTRLITSVGSNLLLALSSSEQVFSGSPYKDLASGNNSVGSSISISLHVGPPTLPSIFLPSRYIPFPSDAIQHPKPQFLSNQNLVGRNSLAFLTF